jgi:hypothetical protein
MAQCAQIVGLASEILGDAASVESVLSEVAPIPSFNCTFDPIRNDSRIENAKKSFPEISALSDHLFHLQDHMRCILFKLKQKQIHE